MDFVIAWLLMVGATILVTWLAYYPVFWLITRKDRAAFDRRLTIWRSRN